MSNVAMCDGCGIIFSLNEEGWESFMRQKKENHPHSNMPVVVSETLMHMCRACAPGGGLVPMKPRIAIPEEARTNPNRQLSNAPD